MYKYTNGQIQNVTKLTVYFVLPCTISPGYNSTTFFPIPATIIRLKSSEWDKKQDSIAPLQRFFAEN